MSAETIRWIVFWAAITIFFIGAIPRAFAAFIDHLATRIVDKLNEGKMND